MSDDVRAALRDLAGDVGVPALDLAGLRVAAGRRRRARRLSVAAALGVVLVVAPLAWSAVPAGREQVVQPAPLARPDTGDVSGSFAVRYDAATYDERAADAALSACSALPGLRGTVQADSLPPQQGYAFAGSRAEQRAAQRCLEAVPAAVVTFTADPAFVPVVLLSAGQRGAGPLTQRPGPVRASADGWVEHDVVLTNTSGDPVEVDPFRLAQVLGGTVFASSGLCSYSHPDVACLFPYSQRRLLPGQSLPVTVQLRRDLAGLAPLQRGRLDLVWPIEVQTGGGTAVVTLELAYEVLSLAAPERASAAAPPTAAPPAAPTAGPTVAPTRGQPSAGTQQVTVFFSRADDASPNCDGVAPVTRTVPATEAVARAALEQLFAGPTEDEERAHGVASAFSRRTAGILNAVRIDNGVAYVDLQDFSTVEGAATELGGYGTSCGMGAFFGQVETTLRQFPTVREVRYAFDGDPRAFQQFVQGGCPDEPVPPGDPCDPAPFRR